MTLVLISITSLPEPYDGQKTTTLGQNASVT